MKEIEKGSEQERQRGGEGEAAKARNRKTTTTTSNASIGDGVINDDVVAQFGQTAASRRVACFSSASIWFMG